MMQKFPSLVFQCVLEYTWPSKQDLHFMIAKLVFLYFPYSE